jgi:hypothetical protein
VQSNIPGIVDQQVASQGMFAWSSTWEQLSKLLDLAGLVGPGGIQVQLPVQGQSFEEVISCDCSLFWLYEKLINPVNNPNQ